MSPSYFDQLEAELRDAVPRAANAESTAIASQRSGRSWWLRRPLLALNAVAVVGIAAALLVFLGHGGSARHGAPPAGSHTLTRRIGPPHVTIAPAGANPTLRQLLANFAILRRPQTPADRSWKADCDCGSAATQLSRYTRLVRTLPGGYRLFFDLQRFNAPGQDNLPAGSYVLEYDVVGAHGNSFSEAFGPNTNFTVYPSAAGDHTFISVVPDGVSTVSWRFACAGGASRCAGVRPYTVTVPVSDNAAVKRISKNVCIQPSELTPAQRRNRKAVLRGLTHCDRPDQTTWRDAAGRVIGTFAQTGGNLAAPPFVRGHQAAGELKLLTARGIGAAHIGQPVNTVVSALDKALGLQTVTHARDAACRGLSEIVWASPAVAFPLTVFVRDGRFIGYRYGAPVSQIGLTREPGTLLTTRRGLTLEESTARAHQMYGTAFHSIAPKRRTPTSQGSWTLADTADGNLSGALIRANPGSQLGTITAGQTACP